VVGGAYGGIRAQAPGGPLWGPLGYPPDRIDVLQPDFPDHEEPEQDLGGARRHGAAAANLNAA
jgi:hypothetical protein